VSLTSEQVEALLQITHEAALGSSFLERMDAISHGLDLAIHTTSMIGFVFDPCVEEPPRAAHLFSRNRPVSDLVDYNVHYRRIDPMEPRLLEARGDPFTLSDCMTPHTFGKDEFTCDFLTGRVRVRHILGSSHQMPDGRVFGFSVHREKGLRDFNDRDREFWRLAAPELASAVRGSLLKEKLGELAAASVDSSSTDCSAGAMLFNELGDLVYADASAIALLHAVARDALPIEDVLVSMVREVARLPLGRGAEKEERFALEGGGWLLVRLSRFSGSPANVLAMLEARRGRGPET
jgi:hypothetical protein